jgi:hypothetical protein
VGRVEFDAEEAAGAFQFVGEQAVRRTHFHGPDIVFRLRNAGRVEQGFRCLVCREVQAAAAEALVPEMAHAGEDHGEPGFVGGGDDLVLSRIEPPGWMTAGGAGLRSPRRCSSPSANGEERIRRPGDRSPWSGLGPGRAPSAMSSALRAAMRAESTRLIWPAPMPTVAPSFIDDGVRLHVLGNAEGEEQVGQFAASVGGAW